MKHFPSHPGYALLISILVIGVMAAATASSLMLLGWAAEQNGFLVQQATQAEENARSCVERIIRAMRLDPKGEIGAQSLTLPNGSCTIRMIVGDGVNDRRVCVEGKNGDTVRRFQLQIAELFPKVRTSSFTEVTTFTLCP